MLRVTPIYGSSLSSSETTATSSPSATDDDYDITAAANSDNDDPLEWLSSPVPSCTLVEYAGMKLLLNAGWDESLPSGGGENRNNNNNNNNSGGGGSSSDENNNHSAAELNKPIIPEELPDVDAILVCDSTLSSLGGLPLYFGASKASKRGRAPRSLSENNKNDNNCNSNSNNNNSTANGDVDNTQQQKQSKKTKRRNPPFLATYPTVKMGQMSLYDHHASLSLDGCHPGYSLEDIDAVFGKDSFRTLKYSQTFYLPADDDDDDGEDDATDAENGNNNPNQSSKTILHNSKTSNKLLAITPHLSGHVVGGCYWVLKQLSDDTEIILAPTYHHAKEKHLAGSSLHKFGLNADALLTMPGGARGLLGKLYKPPTPKDKIALKGIVKYKGNRPVLAPPLGNRSEAELIESIMAALRRDGNVLLPTDASGRVLELLLVLDRHWERQRLGGAYNLCWVGPMCLNTLEFARSQLEWMAAPLGAQFDSQRGHPFALKSVKICSSIGELEGVIERSNGNPTCVLASGASMDHGPARDLLVRWGNNPDNLIMITDSTRCVPRGDVWFKRHGGRGAAGIGGSDKQSAAKENESGGAVGNEPILATATSVVEETAETTTEETDGGALMALQSSDVSAYTTSSQLLYAWCAAKAANQEMADEVAVDVHVPHRAPLAGEELRAFLAGEEEERRRQRVEEERKAMMKEIELARGRLRLGDEDTGGTGGAGGKSGGGAAASNAVSKSSSGKTASTASSSSRPKKKSRFDQNLFIKFSKPVHMTFSVREEAVGIGQPDSIAKYGIGESVGRSGEVLEDDYGIAVRAESFVDIVTGVDPSRFAGRSGRIGEEVTRRGLGFGADGRPVAGDAGGAGRGAGELGDNTMQVGDGDDEGINEKMLEVADLSSGKGIIKGRNGRPPVKVSVVSRRLEVLAEVVYTPLEGRVDARAARQSVRALQPRHLVVIGGPRSSALLLADALRTSSGDDREKNKGSSSLAHIPGDGETVRLTVGHAAYGVRLVDTPYLTLEEREEMELAGKDTAEPPAAAEPFEAKIGDCSVSLVDFVATGKKWAVDGSIVLAPRPHKSTLKQPSLMLSTREVLLTDLRAEVTALGMKAEYGALSGYSQLIVNGKIFVRKDNATGKLDVEGPLCQDFYTVRSVVCGQYVTI